MFSSPLKLVLSFVAVFAVTFYSSNDVCGQRGFRIGNVFQAGGGQGFRMGGPRFGMHFGGGQGATIGGQNYGMRFGNGQGARIGGANYGMQFGGGQGTQIGALTTTPTGTPGSYYYGDVYNRGVVQPGNVPATNYQPGAIPTTPAQPSINNGAIPTTPAQPSINNGAIPTTPAQPSINNETSGIPAQNSNPVSTVAAPRVTTNLNGRIWLRYPAEATQPMSYQLNGTKFSFAPGGSVWMAGGQEWRVVFSPGEGYENRQVKLTESGEYVFRNTDDQGWVLTQKKRTPALLPTIRTPRMATPAIADPNGAQSVLERTPREPTPVETPAKPANPETAKAPNGDISK